MTLDLLSFLLGIGTALTILLAGICGIVVLMPPIKFLQPPAPPIPGIDRRPSPWWSNRALLYPDDVP